MMGAGVGADAEIGEKVGVGVKLSESLDPLPESHEIKKPDTI